LTLPDWPLPWLAAGALVLALLLALSIPALRFWRRRRARRALLAQLGAVSSAHLKDVILPDGNGGWFHVDFLLLTASGMLVLDLRDVPGLIFGSEQMNEWTVMHKNERKTFPNPLGPLYDRVAAVRLLAGEGVAVEGRVVFTERGTFPKGQPPLVTRLAALAHELPAAAPAAEGAAAAPLDPAWARVCEAATPSPLSRR
jgi:hypothetical protein